jgi:hypothetical protein
VKKIVCIAIAIGIVGVFVFLAIPSSIDVNDYINIEDSERPRSKEKFYVNYLELVQENSEKTIDEDVNLNNSTEVVANVSKVPVNSSSSGNIVSWDWQSQIEGRAKVWAEYSELAYTADIPGVGNVIWELQTGNTWSTYKASKETVVGQGCFLYAACAYVSNKTGKWYTIEDMFNSLGGEVYTVNDTYMMCKNKALQDFEGSATKLNTILNAAGLTVTVRDLKAGWDKINESALNNGTWYILYVLDDNSKGVLSNSGKHWFVVVASDTDNWYILCGPKGKTQVSKSEVSGLNITHVYEIGG